MTAAQPNSPDIADWLRLVRADGVGPKTFARLVEYFGSVQKALAAPASHLRNVKEVGPKTSEAIARTRDKFDADKELALCAEHGVWLINYDDSRYPPALKAIYDPPPVLYIKGTLKRADSLAVAIVGARRCSTYGSEQASRFAHMLAASGFTVVSGMARGIDSAAHRGALSAKGRTIAVQGCGLSNIFPPENDKLAAIIAESGALLSELPMKYEPLSENFPGRNRIIAGLATAVIVVEATANSGALITANAALEQDRDVMAVPGKIDSPLSAGPHLLLKQGARLIDSVEDIMETLGIIGAQLKDHAANASAKARRKAETPLFDAERLNLTDAEKAVFNALDHEPAHVEQLIIKTSLTAGAVNAALVSLRLKGLIKHLPGNMFIKL
jgi:DNA processing protein